MMDISEAIFLILMAFVTGVILAVVGPPMWESIQEGIAMRKRIRFEFAERDRKEAARIAALAPKEPT